MDHLAYSDHITYICYFVASYLFSLWFDWFYSLRVLHKSLTDRKSTWLSRTYEYPSQFQKFCCLHGFHSSSDLHFPYSLSQAVGTHSNGTNYNWYHRQILDPKLLQLLGKILVSISHFTFFHFPFIVSWCGKIQTMAGISWTACISKSYRNTSVSFF